MIIPPISPRNILPLSPLPAPDIQLAATQEIGPAQATRLINGAAGYFVQMPNQSNSVVNLLLPATSLMPGTEDLLLAMLVRGSESTKRLRNQLENQGISLHAGRLNEHLCISISGPVGQETQLSNTLLALLTQPIIDPASFNTEKSNLIKNEQGMLNSPDLKFQTALKQRIYGPNHPFSLSPSDRMQIVAQQDLPSLMTRYQQMLQSMNQAKLLMITPQPITEQQRIINDAIRQHAWFRQPYSPLNIPASFPLPNPVGVSGPLLLGNNLLNRALIKSVWKAPDVCDPDYAPYQLLNLLLRGQFDGSFFQKLRTQDGLVYSVNLQEGSKLAQGNCYQLGFEVDLDKVGLALKDIQEVTQNVCQNSMSPSLLNSIKRQYLLASRLEQQQSEKIADQYSSWLTYNAPPPNLHQLHAAIERVTPADIQRVANRIFNPATGAFQTLGVSAPAPVLRQWFPGQPISPI